MIFFNAFSGVLTVFLVAFLGYVLRRKGWIGQDTVKALPRFITMVVMPPFLLRSITATFEKEQFLTLLSSILVPAASILICFGLAVGLCSLLAVREGRRGAFTVAFVAANTMNIGLPINIALFGESAIPYILVFFIAGEIFFWTAGNYCLARDGDRANVKLFSLESCKRVLSPPFIGFCCGIALVLLDVSLPEFLDKTFKYVGEMTIALSLIYIGIMMGDTKLRELVPDRDAIMVLIGKMILSPVIMLVLAQWLSVPDMMRNVFVMQSCMPVMLNAAILTGYFRGDVQFMTVVASLSSLICIATIPLWAVVLELV